MERAPKRVKDRTTDSIFDFIFRNALGTPIIFTSEPTKAQMKANSWGISGTTLFIKFGNNVVLKFTGTEVS